MPTGTLAAFYELPPAYLNKQLQALVRAVSLLDIVAAIEGRKVVSLRPDPRQGPGEHAGVDYRQSCAFAHAMRGAGLAWRRELAGKTVADVRADVEHGHPESPANTRARIAELR